MPFNTPEFLFGFLPLVLLGTALAERVAGRRWTVAWVVLASLVFYGWNQKATLLGVLLASIGINYAAGRAITARRRRWVLLLGVTTDLALLGWFKYGDLVSAELANAGLPVAALPVSLPIGISFFTFAQIGYLVDAYRGAAHRYRLLDYTVFVTMFPHLIAGPILRHGAILPQLARQEAFRTRAEDLALGLTWFVAGLFKKTVLADGMAPAVDAVFAAAGQGGVAGGDAWLGATGYALQLYFDFSGYSDMAIGLAFMLGIAFPINFDSPYQARSLIEFWRRWHITLSQFLRDYLYIPLGGNRRGETRRLINLFTTMVLGGIWHGAGWTFALWGALHGGGLVVNHLWRRSGMRLPPFAGQALTLLAVVVAWVPFRAATVPEAVRIWTAMLRPDGGVVAGWAWVAALAAIALLLPNTGQVFGPGGAHWTRWRASPLAAAMIGTAFAISLARMAQQPSAFLYFRF